MRNTGCTHHLLAPLLLLGALLAACAGPEPAPSPATAPTAEPTPTGAPATAAPSPAPEPTPTPPATTAPTREPVVPPTVEVSGILPEPLYLLIRGQIYVMTTDAYAPFQVSDDQTDIADPDALDITQFDVSPVENTIAYILQSASGNQLKRFNPNETDPVTLFEAEKAGADTPLWSPDGTMLAVRLSVAEGSELDLPNGVYLIPAEGGEPVLVQADDPLPDPANPSFDNYGYQPVAWSPDGSRLLLSRFSLTVEICELAIKQVSGGELVLPVAPSDDLRISCGVGAWSFDGSAVYATFVPMDDRYPSGAGLWRVDAATGAATPVVPVTLDGQVPLVSAPREVAPGRILAFVALAPELPPLFYEGPQPEYAMAAIDVATGEITFLRDPDSRLPLRVLWAGDGSGAVALLSNDPSAPVLMWLPADGSEAIELPVDWPYLLEFDWGVREAESS